MRPLPLLLALMICLFISVRAATVLPSEDVEQPELRFQFERNELFLRDGVVVAPGGKRLAFTHVGYTRIVERGGNEIARAGFGSLAEFMTFSPDGNRMAIVARPGHIGDPPFSIRIREINKGKVPLLRELKVDAPYCPRGHLMHASFSADGKRLAAGTDLDVVLVWDVNTGKLLRRFVGGVAVHFTRNGKTLIAVTHDGLVRRFDADTYRPLAADPKERRDFHYVLEAVFSANDERVALSDGHSVVIKDLYTGETVQRIKLTGAYGQLQFLSPDGKILAVAGTGLHCYDVASGRTLGWLPKAVQQTGHGSSVAYREGDRFVVVDLKRALSRLQPCPAPVRASPEVPVTARLVARRDTYTLDLSGEAVQQLSEDIQRFRPFTGHPEVDLLLVLENTGTEVVELDPEIRTCEPDLYLEGPGALNCPPYSVQTAIDGLEGERPRPIKLLPGQSLSIPIHFTRSETRPYWLLPGTYTISGRLHFSMSPAPAGVDRHGNDMCFVSMHLEPVKVKVLAKRDDAAPWPLRLRRRPGAEVPPGTDER
ncbi:MAG: WD40 repeat domain-containing protein [Gemmataceae bacterium]